ncbi:aminoglycoside phosphotransferase family protein [Leucothrix sargassi]|nr:aminoglycoside phosphotransferase family protein [Leucothrix sargassi]
MQLDWRHTINTQLGQSLDWQAFAKGSSNTLYQAGEIVVRVNAPASLTPGVDRKREAALLKLITPYAWSPKIIENAYQQGWCAMKRYTPYPDTHLSEDHKTQCLQAIGELQQIDTRQLSDSDALTIHYEALWDTLYLPEAVKQNNTQALQWIERIKQLLSELPETQSCLVHHDLHTGNLALDEHSNTLILLDWEYGGIGNPWIDAATLKSLLGVADSEIATLPAFQAMSHQRFSQGLTQATELFETISAIWHWLRGTEPTQP